LDESIIGLERYFREQQAGCYRELCCKCT